MALKCIPVVHAGSDTPASRLRARGSRRQAPGEAGRGASIWTPSAHLILRSRPVAPANPHANLQPPPHVPCQVQTPQITLFLFPVPLYFCIFKPTLSTAWCALLTCRRNPLSPHLSPEPSPDLALTRFTFYRLATWSMMAEHFNTLV